MINFKRLAAIAIIIGMSTEMAAHAVGIVYDEPEYNQTNTSVRLTGNIDGCFEKPIGITIIPSDTDISKLSDANLPSDIQMAVTDENGYFDITIYIPKSLPSGSYKAVISGDFEESGIYREFSYVSEKEAAEVIGLINSAATASELEKVFTPQNLAKLAIKQDEYNEIKDRLIPSVISRKNKFSSSSEFAVFYNNILAMYLINSGKVSESLEKYRVDLNIDITAYRALNSVQKTEFERLLKEYNYTNAVFSDIYAQNLVLAKVRTAEKWSDIKQYVTEATDVLKLSMTEYNNLSDKDAVFMAMFKASYTKFSDIKSEFDSAVSALSKGNSNNSSGGSSGGSGGSVGYNKIPNSTPGAASPTPTPDKGSAVFSDIAGHWAEHAILSMYNEGVIAGYPDGSFRPDGIVTRAEFAKIIAVKADNAEITQKFDDVNESDWYYEPVSRLYNSGIVHGDENKFRPLENIKREDAAVMLYNMLKTKKEMQTVELSYNDSTSVTAYAEEAVSGMSAAGILNGDDNNSFNPQGITTRAEAITMMMKAEAFLDGTLKSDVYESAELGEIIEDTDKDSIFENSVEMISAVGCNSIKALELDKTAVPTQSEFIEYLTAAIGIVPEVDNAQSIDKKEILLLDEAAKLAGIIPDKYEPENSMTIGMAVETCLKVANYEQYMQLMGELPHKRAMDLKLYKDISQNDSDIIDVSSAFILIRNTLKSDYMKYTYNYDSKSYKPIDDGETVLSYYRHVYNTDGIVSADSHTSLTDENGGTIDGMMKIGGEIYNADNAYSELLGQNVTAYYKEQDTDERALVYAEPIKNVISHIDAQNIDLMKDGYMYYYASESKLKKYKLNKSICFIYNGVAYNEYTESDYRPASGTVTLIDNNNDGNYDIVSITAYEYMFVDSINAIDLIITENGNRAIDVSDDDIESTFYRMDKNDNYYPVEIYDFCTNVPIKIRASKNGKLIDFYETDYISGTVTQKGGDVIAVDGTEYEAGRSLSSGNIVPEVGYQGLFVKSDSNTIVYYYQKNESGSYRYGYLMNIYTHEDGDGISIKLYDQRDEFRNIELNKKLKLDGDTASREEALNRLVDQDRNTVKQLIRYSLSDSGTVNGIDILSDFDFNKDGYKTPENNTDSLTKYYDGKYNLKNDYNVCCFADGNLGFNASGSTVFIIGNDQTAKDDDNYNIGLDYLSNGTQYQIEAYDIDGGGTAGAIVCSVDSASKTINVNVSSALITDVKTGINEDDEVGYDITYYSDGKYQTAYIGSNISAIKSSGKPIAPGDVVRLVVNENSKVTQMSVDCDFETKKSGDSSGSYFDNEFAYLSYSWSSLYSYKNNYLLVSNTKDGNGEYNYSANKLQNYCMNNAKIVIYDRESKVARSATAAELRDYATYGSDADLMLVRKCYYAPRLVIVYR